MHLQSGRVHGLLRLRRSGGCDTDDSILDCQRAVVYGCLLWSAGAANCKSVAVIFLREPNEGKYRRGKQLRGGGAVKSTDFFLFRSTSKVRPTFS
jgi:hypothetical protein